LLDHPQDVVLVSDRQGAKLTMRSQRASRRCRASTRSRAAEPRPPDRANSAAVRQFAFSLSPAVSRLQLAMVGSPRGIPMAACAFGGIPPFPPVLPFSSALALPRAMDVPA
jgi:hypothetical protein